MRAGDFIFVKDLLVKCISGRDGWSRGLKQPAMLNIAIRTNQRLKHMALSDDIRRTLNYDSLSTSILERLESQNYLNMQDTALDALNIIKKQISKGEWAQLSLKQPKSLLQTKNHEIVAETTSENLGNKIKETLHGLDLRTIIGINDLERVREQLVTCDIQIERDARNPNGQSTVPLFTNEVVELLSGDAAKVHMLTIESFVNFVAERICELLPSIKEVTVKAGKPNALNMAAEAAVQVTRAPALNFAPAAVDKSDKLHTVYLAYGTNQGDRIANIQQSVHELKSLGISVEMASSIFQSDPKYFTDQPQFLNGVFKCTTSLSPHDLLSALKTIEYDRFGRVKLFDNGPRTFDLDIILYDNEFLESESLTIPHRDMLNRSFVLRPLNELLPEDMRFSAESDGENVIFPLYVGGSDCTEVVNFMEVNPYSRSHQTHIMAIMNVTPDSFSDGGMLTSESLLINKAREHIDNGATILDIGGYSTRPGASEVSPEEESNRVCQAIRALRQEFPSIVISVDTFRGSVARDALNTGANIINDVFSGLLDSSIFTVAAEMGAPLILSHSRGDPKVMKHYTDYPAGIIDGVALELRDRIDAALNAGCQAYQLILDPGIGFAKTSEQDLEIVRSFEELCSSPYLNNGLPRLPWLVGPSRKSFIGKLADEPVAKDRVPGTVAIITALKERGMDIARVHDTKPVSQALKVVDALCK